MTQLPDVTTPVEQEPRLQLPEPRAVGSTEQAIEESTAFGTWPPQAIIAVLVSTTALAIAALNYRRKAGTYVRGNHKLTWSRSSGDPYTSSITLTNLKDRAVTVFAVYLRVGHRYYIELEDLQESPLMLRPFETYHKEYGAIEFYASGPRRINMNPVLDHHSKNELVLSTSEGRYVVKPYTRIWSPIYEYFNNLMTTLIKPIRTQIEGEWIGGNAKYVVVVENTAGRKEVVPLHPDDHRLKIFKGFMLTEEALADRDALQAYLLHQQASGALLCRNFAVHDMESWRAENRDFYRGDVTAAVKRSMLHYHILGRLGTLLLNRKLRRDNMRAARRVDK